jgi:geranylgeranyl pyrophosphate synthase
MHFAPIPPVTAGLLDAVTQQMLIITQTSGAQASGTQSPTHIAIRHHLGAPGQRVRSQIALHVAECMAVDAPSAMAFATCCELLHNASLIHDDLQDGDTMRRGSQAVWALFGKDVALCVGDLLLSAAYVALSQISDLAALPRLITTTHAAVAQTIRGQVFNPLTADPELDPLKVYQSMAASKSGALLALPFTLVFSYLDRADLVATAARAVRAFSIAYQIADDLADLESDERTPLGAAANIVVVLETTLGLNRAMARQRAAEMARSLLAEARDVAAALPNLSGTILADLATRIITKLDRV